MAQCACGKKVGCSCNLINGLCIDCYTKQQQETLNPPPPPPKPNE